MDNSEENRRIAEWLELKNDEGLYRRPGKIGRFEVPPDFRRSEAASAMIRAKVREMYRVVKVKFARYHEPPTIQIVAELGDDMLNGWLNETFETTDEREAWVLFALKSIEQEGR